MFVDGSFFCSQNHKTNKEKNRFVWTATTLKPVTDEGNNIIQRSTGKLWVFLMTHISENVKLFL